MIFKDNKLFVLVDTFDDFKSLKLSVDETDTIYITYDNQEQTFGTPDVLWSQLVFVKSNKLIYSKGVIWTDNEFPAYDITTQDIERWDSLISHVRADWSVSDPSSYSYILNKNIVSDELSYLHTAYDQFTINYEKTNYVIASALTDLDTRVNNIDIPILVHPDWNTSDTTSYAYILNKPTIPDITGKADKSDAIGSLSLTLDQSTYVITLSGTKVDGTAFTVNNTIDLPLESVVVSGNYNNTTKKVELTLKNGSVVDFSVADIISGLQSEITSSNKLSGDLIEDGTNNKIINVKSDWNETSISSYAYILNKPSIPDDSNLVHKTGDETIGGDKTFNNSIIIKNYLRSDNQDSTEFDWIFNPSKGDKTRPYSLDDALNERNNIQSDWNESDSTSYAYIKNKPIIPTLVQPDWLETITTSPAYIQNSYIVTDELAYLHTAYDQFISYYEDDNYTIATALTNLDKRINNIDIPTLVKSDWNETSTSSYAYIKNKPTIPSLVKSDWNESDSTSYAYISNKPSIPDSISDLIQDINYAVSGTSGGAALKTGSIPFGIVDSTSTSTEFTATVPGITELTDGTCVLLKNGVVTSATGFTIDINNLGAHPVFSNMSNGDAETTIFNDKYTMLFVYDSTRVVNDITGAWCCYRGYYTNTDKLGYIIRCDSASLPCSDTARYYKIYFTSADGTQWVPASSNKIKDATASKVVNQRPINPFGPIVYMSSSSSYNAGTVLTADYACQQNILILGHSFNWTGEALTLTINKPVYVKCAPQSDGSAIIDSTTPIVQDLPTTEDGKIYIFLGIAYSETNIELRIEHPVFYYKNGAIRVWTNAPDTTLGTLNTNNTSAQTANSSESFGSTINLHKVSKTGNYNDLLNKPTALTNSEIGTIWDNVMNN